MTKKQARTALIKALQFEGWKDADKCTDNWSLEEMTVLLNKLFYNRMEREGHLDFLKATN